MLTAAILFILVNIPLSAYETVQEFTYFPNSSVPPPPLSGLVPSALRQSTNHFSPQHLDVGQSFRLNNSALSYTIGSAFDSVENGETSNFIPTNVSAVVQTHTADSAKRYQYYDYSSHSGHGVVAILTDVFGRDLRAAMWYGRQSYGVFKPVLPHGCVLRTRCHQGHRTPVLHMQCTYRLGCPTGRSLAAHQRALPFTTSQFIGLTGQLTNTTSNFAPWGYYWSVTNTTSLFSGADPQFRKGYIGVNDLSALDTPFQNLFQIMYHLVRSDLGVVFNNQIFDSADMFNKSILALDVPADLITYEVLLLARSDLLRLIQCGLLLEPNDDGRVAEYLRPVSRRKSLGSAIVAVFVATFTMLSAVWTIFGLVAQGLVKVSQQDKDVDATELELLSDKTFEMGHNDDRVNDLLQRITLLTKRMEEIESAKAGLKSPVSA
ncbi:hypothetical protein R3P38DRAFT_2791515 [Favolaschia claudopus]|uniref:Uncharacterized protein n=1 Tax=Favolaschia claudopus TaxID=2862362 RepID=A0AAW0AGQ6_9AGAR